MIRGLDSSGSPELPWSYADDFSELPGKIVAVIKAGLICDLDNRDFVIA